MGIDCHLVQDKKDDILLGRWYIFRDIFETYNEISSYKAIELLQSRLNALSHERDILNDALDIIKKRDGMLSILPE